MHEDIMEEPMNIITTELLSQATRGKIKSSPAHNNEKIRRGDHSHPCVGIYARDNAARHSPAC